MLRKDPEKYARLRAEGDERRAMLEKLQLQQGLIPRIELRDVVRIGSLWFQAIDAGEEIRDQAWSTKFLLGTCEVASAGEIVTRYKLNDIYDAFFNRKRYSRPD